MFLNKCVLRCGPSYDWDVNYAHFLSKIPVISIFAAVLEAILASKVDGAKIDIPTDTWNIPSIWCDGDWKNTVTPARSEHLRPGALPLSELLSRTLVRPASPYGQRVFLGVPTEMKVCPDYRPWPQPEDLQERKWYCLWFCWGPKDGTIAPDGGDPAQDAPPASPPLA